MNVFDLERKNRRYEYENNYFFHKGRWVTRAFVDGEKNMERWKKLYEDVSLSYGEKIQKFFS